MLSKLTRIVGATATALFLLAAPALAQGNMTYTGPATPGHTVRCADSTCATLTDGGGSGGSETPGQGYLTELGITASGTPFCIDDNFTGAPGSTAGYHRLCFGANALGGGIISYNAYGAPPLPFIFNINGVNIPIPGAGTGTVVGPISSAVGDVAVFNNTTGTIIADSASVIPLVPTAALNTDTQQVANTAYVLNALTSPPPIGVAPNTGKFTNLSATTMGLFGLNTAPQFVAGNQTGTNPWLKTLYEQNPGDISSILGLYTGNTQAFLGVSNRVSAATDPTGATAGQLTAGVISMMTNNGSILDATPMVSVCKNAANAAICTGLNIILTGGSGLSGTEDEIVEGDLQTNSAPSNSNGTQMIAFLEPYGNAFALSSADSIGTFQTGLGIAGIAAGGEGILFGASPVQTMDVGIDFGSGDIYSAGAIRLYASTSGVVQQGLYLIGGTGNNASLYQDSSHNILWNIASGEYAIRNNAGTSNLFVLHPTGDALFGTGSALATTATTGYTYIPAMAGAPTGVPTYGSAGYSAIVNDTTDHKLCWYEFPNTAWKCATGS
jgi:hypothetical protein